MIQLFVLILLGAAIWKLHHDFNDDRLFTDASSLSDGHVKQALATGGVVAKFGTPGESFWPRYDDRMCAYRAEAERRGIAVKP